MQFCDAARCWQRCSLTVQNHYKPVGESACDEVGQDAKALYGRGLAKHRNGDATGGDADMAAAKALDPDVEKGLH